MFVLPLVSCDSLFDNASEETSDQVSQVDTHDDEVLIWQYSAASVVRLGARSKMGESSYNAVFMVTGPDGNARHSTKDIENDSFGYVYFPDDFATAEVGPGTYTWECHTSNALDDNPIGSGQFTFETVDSYADQLHVIRR